MPDEYYHALAKDIASRFGSLKKIALTRRKTYSSNSNDFTAMVYDCASKQFVVSRTYHIASIVDRVGSGDAFTAGLIYGLRNFCDDKKSVDFGAALCCLKHSVPGDVALVRKDEVLSLMESKGDARIKR